MSSLAIARRIRALEGPRGLDTGVFCVRFLWTVLLAESMDLHKKHPHAITGDPPDEGGGGGGDAAVTL